jgi:hypothetical protein
VTPGWRTSEFWVTVISSIAAALGIAVPNVNPSGGTLGVLALVGGIVVAYIGSRAHVKATVAKSAVPPAPVPSGSQVVGAGGG